MPGGGARANRAVVFIGGAGHSGSTLLGLALGAHRDVFYAGEASKSAFLGDPETPLRKRTCKVCGPGCPVWTELEPTPEIDLYEALSRRTGRRVIVDSTKALGWLEAQAAGAHARGAKVALVFLGRDGRAVLSSGLRKHPEVSAREHAERWRAQIAATEGLASRFPGPVVRVRYEALVTAPEATLRALAGALGVAFEAAMLEPFASEQHPLGGNAGTQSLLERTQTAAGGAIPISGAKRDYYAAHPKAFVLDLRWQRELSPEALADFEAIAGELNRTYAWNDRGSE